MSKRTVTFQMERDRFDIFEKICKDLKRKVANAVEHLCVGEFINETLKGEQDVWNENEQKWEIVSNRVKYTRDAT